MYRDTGALDNGAPPLGPWLVLLCALLLVWTPASFALVASTLVESLPVRGAPVTAILAIRLVAAATGISAGLALAARRPGAPLLAKTAIVLSFAADLIAYLTPWFPSNRLPGTTPVYVAASLAYHAAWFAYLVRSKRVRSIW